MLTLVLSANSGSSASIGGCEGVGVGNGVCAHVGGGIGDSEGGDYGGGDGCSGGGGGSGGVCYGFNGGCTFSHRNFFMKTSFHWTFSSFLTILSNL